MFLQSIRQPKTSSVPANPASHYHAKSASQNTSTRTLLVLFQIAPIPIDHASQPICSILQYTHAQPSNASVSDPVPDRVVAAPWLSAILIASVVSFFSGDLPQTPFFFPRSQINSHLSYVLSFIQYGSGASLHLRSVGNSDCPNSEDKDTPHSNQNRSVVSEPIDYVDIRTPTM